MKWNGKKLKTYILIHVVGHLEAQWVRRIDAAWYLKGLNVDSVDISVTY